MPRFSTQSSSTESEDETTTASSTPEPYFPSPIPSPEPELNPASPAPEPEPELNPASPAPDSQRAPSDAEVVDDRHALPDFDNQMQLYYHLILNPHIDHPFRKDMHLYVDVEAMKRMFGINSPSREPSPERVIRGRGESSGEANNHAEGIANAQRESVDRVAEAKDDLQGVGADTTVETTRAQHGINVDVTVGGETAGEEIQGGSNRKRRRGNEIEMLVEQDLDGEQQRRRKRIRIRASNYDESSVKMKMDLSENREEFELKITLGTI